jgi:hypothetical protein
VNASLKGSQQPTLSHEPDGAVDWRLSDIAVDWARDVGGYILDDWQRDLVRWAFVRRTDGLWAARDFGVEVGRQNGKNIVLEVIEAVGVFEFGDRLITHSAHRADVSHEHFLSLKARIEASDDLMRMMPLHEINNGFITTNGNESIKLDSGARILFKARAKASGRGPRPQKIVFDEALVLGAGQVGSMAPSISAQKNPQVLFASSAPMADSSVLHRLRARAANPEPGERLFYAAWNNPTGISVSDQDALYRVNPSLGYGRLTEESLLANRRLMSDEEFLREHLGVPEAPADDTQSVIPNWSELKDLGSRIVTHRHLALDVSPDRRWASIGAAGRDDNGRLFVEAYTEPGTSWVIDGEHGALAAWKSTKCPVRVERTGPAGSFIEPLRERGVEVVEVSHAEVGHAVGQVLDACANDSLRHWDGLNLGSAVAGAVLRDSGDTWVWSRKHSKVDISPLVAVTIAAGGVPAPSEVPQGLFVAVS